MDYHPIHAPLEQSHVRKILDIGCGVNADMTIFLAKQYPDAVVYGVDLSPINIPEDCPANVRFVTGNVYDLVEKHDDFPAASIDYIYSRLIISGVKDWDAHAKKVCPLLRPGGWIELHDLCRLDWFNNQDEVISSNWEWIKAFKTLFAERNFDFTGMLRVTDILQKEGLESAQQKRYRMPWSTSLDHNSKEENVSYAVSGGAEVWITAVDAWWPGEENAAKRENIKEDIRRTLGRRADMYLPFLAVWARKPE